MTRSCPWTEVDWSAHQRREKIEGRWLNFIDIGSGPALLFVHGLAGSWQNWLENISFFADDHRVIAVDLPGFGESEMPARPISISGYARTLDALCDALDVDTVSVAGNSMGGFVAAEMAIRSPARVEALCLVAAAGLSVEGARADRTKGVRHRIENLMFFYVAWLATKFPALALRPRVRRWMLGLVVAHPEELPGPLIAEQVRGIAKPGFDTALEALTRYPIRDRLGEIACPTLIVWGDQDRLVPLSDAAEFEWLISDSRKLTYEGTGHAPMIEQPDRFNPDLHAFLEQAGRRAARTSGRAGLDAGARAGG